MLAAASPGAAQTPTEEAEACGTVEDCIARLTGVATNGRGPPSAWIGERLYAHGRAGAEALVPLLAHPSEAVRSEAATALDQFEELHPRHAPALIAAHRRGLRVENAIARTGSDEGLRYLEAAWVARGADDPVRSALPLFEERAAPFLLGRLELCRQACSRREAQSILYALGRIRGPLPDRARAVVRDVAASPSAAPELREEMENQLIGSFDRAALPILVRRLRGTRGTENEEWAAAHLIDAIQHHNEAARPIAGALVASYLTRPELRRARIEAAITSLVIRYRPAIPALRSVLADAERDWLAAYHALWALAELDGQEARAEIARIARDHWYLPVRNNARRALNMLDGGAFELPELADEDRRGGYAGNLNFGADVDPVRDCRFDRPNDLARFGRGAPVPTRRPDQGTVGIALEEPSQDPVVALSAFPELSRGAAVTLDWQRGGERILALDAGRRNGGLFVVEPGGAVRRLLGTNVIAAFDAGDALLVLTSDAAGGSEGDLWRLSMRGPIAVAQGPLRLPARPTGFALAGDGTLLLRTERGDLGVNRSGRLLRPRHCAAGAPAQ
ncbi:MAG TPA: hypothetical protein VF603_12915 [Allosphingosinicella sp.]